MRIDLKPSEIREAIRLYLHQKGLKVRREDGPSFADGHTLNLNRNRENMWVSVIQLKTDCSWGGEVTGATVEIEEPEAPAPTGPGPYRGED